MTRAITGEEWHAITQWATSLPRPLTCPICATPYDAQWRGAISRPYVHDEQQGWEAQPETLTLLCPRCGHLLSFAAGRIAGLSSTDQGLPPSH